MRRVGGRNTSEKKTTVEACWSLDAASLARWGVFQRPAQYGAYLMWANSPGKEELSVGYWVEMLTRGNFVLHFLWTVGPDGNRCRTSEAVRLVTTRPNFGGQRWWFLCPLLVDGAKCGRRVRKLYLPSGAHTFGCRSCYDLTYESVQEHDSRVDRLMKDPGVLMTALGSNDQRKAFLAAKAWAKVFGLL